MCARFSLKARLQVQCARLGHVLTAARLRSMIGSAAHEWHGFPPAVGVRMTQGAPQERDVAAGPALDPTVPNPARIWNFWVGGKDHFEADRALAEQFGQVVPKMPLIARLTRQFLTDTVSKL